MEPTDRERLGRGFERLTPLLGAFVDARMRAAAGPEWLAGTEREDAERFGGERRNSLSDPRFLLRMVTEKREVFAGDLGGGDFAAASELRRAGNAYAHAFGGGIDGVDVDRCLRLIDRFAEIAALAGTAEPGPAAQDPGRADGRRDARGEETALLEEIMEAVLKDEEGGGQGAAPQPAAPPAPPAPTASAARVRMPTAPPPPEHIAPDPRGAPCTVRVSPDAPGAHRGIQQALDAPVPEGRLLVVEVDPGGYPGFHAPRGRAPFVLRAVQGPGTVSITQGPRGPRAARCGSAAPRCWRACTSPPRNRSRSPCWPSTAPTSPRGTARSRGGPGRPAPPGPCTPSPAASSCRGAR
ncbi:Swt1 family HEPN domain-containing protein [Nocardiopsis potens]|uniref:Swt1 family HEPN domain-containing protein n=1 Tax=Nocardiopsis potens TaxID=1246458 RepID=UPI000348BB85|nr:Swt1 family HEPN domain-containing protein [Nocardiopsis potens]